MQRSMKNVALAAAAVLTMGAASASAATLGEWNFSEFTTTDAAWPAAPGPYANTASDPAASVTTLSNVGAGALEALRTRDSTAVTLSSHALLIGAGNIAHNSGTGTSPIAATPVSTDDYLGFTLTANQNDLGLSDLSFDLGTSVGANTNATNAQGTFENLTTNVQVFYSIDSGTTFAAIGALHQSIADNSATGANNAGVFTGMNNFNVDLSSLPLLDTTETIEFRLAFGDNRGGGSNVMGHYVDNVIIEGAVIPEPGSLALAGIAGLGMLARRRRQG